jgi:osmoprotectant transport system permease protein
MTGSIAAHGTRPVLDARPALGLAAGAGVAAVLSWLPMLRLAANRLVDGTPISTLQAFGVTGWLSVALAAIGAGLLAGRRSTAARWGALALLVAALVLFAHSLGEAASHLVLGQPPAVRARLASGAWIGLILIGAAVALAAARIDRKGLGLAVSAVLLVWFVLAYRSGRFDGISLAVEYQARKAAIGSALAQHLVLSGLSVLFAGAICLALFAWRRARGAAELAVNGLQVVPAVALLGGLVAATSSLLSAAPFLRGLGLSALGPGPAILAIASYLMLPFWRGLEGAARAPEPATRDAALALGLTRFQTALGVQLPLGAPILIGALRVASVQSIGLATLGALVGAGGLGAIVFDGMAQFAPDLILLGALPVVTLGLMAEFALSWVQRMFELRTSA